MRPASSVLILVEGVLVAIVEPDAGTDAEGWAVPVEGAEDSAGAPEADAGEGWEGVDGDSPSDEHPATASRAAMASVQEMRVVLIPRP